MVEESEKQATVVMPKVGEVLYPHFDGFWRHNKTGWMAINIHRSNKIKGCEWVARVAKNPGDTGGEGFSRYHWDPRMDGKWMTTQSDRMGLVVLIEGEVPVATIVRGKDYYRGELEQTVLPMDPPDEIYALEVTRVGLKSVWAKVVKLEALP